MTTGQRTDRAIDLLLELAALERAARERPAKFGPTVFQKIFFWTKLKLSEQAWASPRLAYFRYTHGPFSRDLATDLKFLRGVGHLDPANFRPTQRGLDLARHWRGLTESANAVIFSTLDGTVAEMEAMDAEEAKALAYALPGHRVGQPSYKTLRDVPQHRALLLKSTEGARRFVIEPDVLDDLTVDLQTTAQDIATMGEPGRILTEAEFMDEFGDRD